LDFLLNEERYMANNKKQKIKEIYETSWVPVAEVVKPDNEKEYVKLIQIRFI
jgi:hypothetical protein